MSTVVHSPLSTQNGTVSLETLGKSDDGGNTNDGFQPAPMKKKKTKNVEPKTENKSFSIGGTIPVQSKNNRKSFESSTERSFQNRTNKSHNQSLKKGSNQFSKGWTKPKGTGKKHSDMAVNITQSTIAVQQALIEQRPQQKHDTLQANATDSIQEQEPHLQSTKEIADFDEVVVNQVPLQLKQSETNFGSAGNLKQADGFTTTNTTNILTTEDDTGSSVEEFTAILSDIVASEFANATDSINTLIAATAAISMVSSSNYALFDYGQSCGDDDVRGDKSQEVERDYEGKNCYPSQSNDTVSNICHFQNDNNQNKSCMVILDDKDENNDDGISNGKRITVTAPSSMNSKNYKNGHHCKTLNDDNVNNTKVDCAMVLPPSTVAPSMPLSEMDFFTRMAKHSVSDLLSQELGEYDPNWQKMAISATAETAPVAYNGCDYDNSSPHITGENSEEFQNTSGNVLLSNDCHDRISVMTPQMNQPAMGGVDALGTGMLRPRGKAPIHIEFVSFGYRHGLPSAANISDCTGQGTTIYDCRHLPSVPHYMEWMDGLSGAVRSVLLRSSGNENNRCKTSNVNSDSHNAGSNPNSSSIAHFSRNVVANAVASAVVEAIEVGGYGYVSPLRMNVYVGSDTGRHRSVVCCELAAAALRKLLRNGSHSIPTSITKMTTAITVTSSEIPTYIFRQPCSVSCFHRELSSGDKRTSACDKKSKPIAGQKSRNNKKATNRGILDENV